MGAARVRFKFRGGFSLLDLMVVLMAVVWVAAMSVHVLAHALRIPDLVMPDLRGGGGVAGSRLRFALVSGAVVAGAIVALATLPLIAPWTTEVGRH